MKKRNQLLTLGIIGSALLGMVVAATPTFAQSVNRPPSMKVSSSQSIAVPVSLAQAQRKVGFPIRVPDSSSFGVKNVFVYHNAPGGNLVDIYLGNPFSKGVNILEQPGNVTDVAPNSSITTIAGYRATVAKWTNSIGLHIVLVSIYNGSDTYALLGTNVPLSEVEGMANSMLNKQ